MEKNMKVNISHHHVSPTPRSDLIQVNVFSVKLLVKMSTVFSVDGQYDNNITRPCTKTLMQCMCIFMCLVFYLCTGSMEILIELLMTHQIIVGESNAKPSSPRIPCNHTHCVVAFIAPLYSALADDKKIACFLLFYYKMVQF